MLFDPVWRVPSSSQFVGALAVTTVVLIFTSVIMTQKPGWMVGKEESLVKGGSIDPPWMRGKGTALKIKAGRSQSLASINDIPSASKLAKLAVEQAAAHPGGLQHLDDYYVPVLDSGNKAKPPSAPASASTEVDENVAASKLQSSMYPLVGGFSETPETYKGPQDAFRAQLKKVGLGGTAVETESGGHGKNEPPYARAIKEASGTQDGFRTAPLNPGDETGWAMYVAVFMVLVGLVVLLAHYLLPQGALYKSFWEDWTVEHDPSTYYPDIQAQPAGPPARYEMVPPAGRGREPPQLV